jgi:hypothetical protein
MLADGMIPRPRLARKAHLVSKNKDLTQSRKDAENGKKEFLNLTWALPTAPRRRK